MTGEVSVSCTRRGRAPGGCELPVEAIATLSSAAHAAARCHVEVLIERHSDRWWRNLPESAWLRLGDAVTQPEHVVVAPLHTIEHKAERRHVIVRVEQRRRADARVGDRREEQTH